MKKRGISLILASFLAAVAVGAKVHAQETEYRVFYGGLHSHTSYSDGEQDPEAAWTYARDAGKADFWAVTDHFEQLPMAKKGGKLDPDKKFAEWRDTLEVRDRLTENGKFIPLAGFEWADNTQGHLNVFLSKEVPPYATTFSLKQFYKWLFEHPGAIAGFNHPSWRSKNIKSFNGYEYKKSLDRQIFYVAINLPEDVDWYFTALDNGWHVGPVAEQDNHDPDWGTKNEHFAGVLARELTRESLFEAFRSLRLFATHDRNAVLILKVDGKYMGSHAQTDGPANVEVKWDDADGETPLLIKVFSLGGKTAKTISSPASAKTHSFEFDSMGLPTWIVAWAVYPDGQFQITSPVWLNEPAPPWMQGNVESEAEKR